MRVLNIQGILIKVPGQIFWKRIEILIQVVLIVEVDTIVKPVYFTQIWVITLLIV